MGEPLNDEQLKDIKPLAKADAGMSSEFLAEETKKLQLEKLGIDVKKEQAKLESFQTDTKTRGLYAHGIFWVTVAWLIAVITIVVLAGTKFLTLSDRVIQTLLTTTTIQVLAMIGAVLAYLFHKAKKGPSGQGSGRGRKPRVTDDP